ncbi:LacI family DNA-binding transcriptional regulator [Polycladidibacter stylochi]|uniref:LacI family DNA-binding transcriptional regulator n=1 Tax=Polycladidibacter stylochi TaxID=1807766 RepID=UPI00082A76D0|nr:LacI family DNA-binding transcriptional regulator [Pseudovibrio stylochi]
MQEKGKRIRLGDIAKKLGVSTATVSLAMRDSSLVAEATRQRVRAFAEEAGYIYNRSAASLRTSTSNMIGVAVHDILNPYFAEVYRGIEETLAAEGKMVLMSNHRDFVGRQQQFVETLLQYRADGLILCPSVGTTAKEINAIQEQGVPVTLVCRDVPGAMVPVVRGDDYTGAYMMTRHLIELGHAHIAMVGGRRSSSAGRDRNLGWRTALEDAGLDPDRQLDIPELMDRNDGVSVVADILEFKPRPTAVMCFNDLVALGVMTGVRRAGVEPGPQLAITGYDNTESGRNRTPALTTVSNGANLTGELAAKLMLRKLNGEDVPANITLIKPFLKLRQSAPSIGVRLSPQVMI